YGPTSPWVSAWTSTTAFPSTITFCHALMSLTRRCDWPSRTGSGWTRTGSTPWKPSSISPHEPASRGWHDERAVRGSDHSYRGDHRSEPPLPQQADLSGVGDQHRAFRPQEADHRGRTLGPLGLRPRVRAGTPRSVRVARRDRDPGGCYTGVPRG